MNILQQFILLFSISFLAFALMRKVPLSNIKLLRKIFYVSARKSNSDAILLGGLVINISMICAIALVQGVNKLGQMETLSIVALIIILIHGYLDDKFEISPRFKLICQLASVSIYSYASNSYLGYSTWYSYVFFGYFGFAILNGSNLLDGLDSMQIKLSSVSFAIFCFYGTFFEINTTLNLSFLALASMIAFFSYNREPAKIHMGEIGANTIGMMLLMLGTYSLKGLAQHYSTSESIALIAIPLSLPVIELAVSFSRRLLAKKSPFKSDRLHVHHILTEHNGYSASGATTIMSLTFLVIAQIAITIAISSPIMGASIAVGGIILGYARIGHRIWFKQEIAKETITYAAKITRLKSKKLKVIPSNNIDDFQFIITTTPVKKGIDYTDFDIAS